MHQGRLRLRPWLEEQIKSGKYPGVMWLDEAARVFQIPWKHAARHGWNIDRDATLFRNWAIHTGKYKPGVDKPDPKTWKANFRCALNSLPDIQELRDKSIKKGHNAFRVYTLLPNSKTSKKRKEPFWNGDSRCIAPVGCPQNVQSMLPSVKEEHSTTYCCSPALISISAHEVQPNAAEDQEQTEAVLKIVNHLQNVEHWSPLYQHDRSWKPANSWMEGLYETMDCASFPFQTDWYHHSNTTSFS